MRDAWAWTMAAMLTVVVGGCDRPAEEQPPSQPAEAQVEEDDAASLVESLPMADLASLEALIAETAERGQVLVVDFWATWCIPCVAMFPDLHAGLKEMGDQVRPVSVTLDDPGEWEQRAIKFLAEQDALEDAFILVSTSAGQMEVVQGMGEGWTDLVVPAILVYDATGELAGEFIDADARTDRILARVRELVEDQSQARVSGP